MRVLASVNPQADCQQEQFYYSEARPELWNIEYDPDDSGRPFLSDAGHRFKRDEILLWTVTKNGVVCIDNKIEETTRR